VPENEERWLPLVDEPLATIIAEIQREDPEIEELVDSPRKLLAFRTFAHLRAGILLGRLLVEREVEPGEGESWAEQLLSDRDVRTQLVEEVRAVAAEIAADEEYADDTPLGPDEGERERFLEFAKRRLAADT
jgi:hypothetical protein